MPPPELTAVSKACSPPQPEPLNVYTSRCCFQTYSPLLPDLANDNIQNIQPLPELDSPPELAITLIPYRYLQSLLVATARASHCLLGSLLLLELASRCYRSLTPSATETCLPLPPKSTSRYLQSLLRAAFEAGRPLKIPHPCRNACLYLQT